MSTRFGGRISFDHAIVGNIPGVAGFRTGLHIDDEASNFQQFFPAKTRSTHEVEYALRTFIGKQTDQVEELYSDNAPEYVKSVRSLRLNSRRSTPRRPTSNARKERKMQVFGDAVATALHQAAMPLSMWPLAGAYVCNVENFVGEEDSPYYWRYGKKATATLRPFGSKVTVVPPPELQEKFGPRAMECLFLGYSTGPGGQFHGEYLATPLDDFLLAKNKIRILKTRDIRFPPELCFPLRLVLNHRRAITHERHHKKTTLTEVEKRAINFGIEEFPTEVEEIAEQTQVEELTERDVTSKPSKPTKVFETPLAESAHDSGGEHPPDDTKSDEDKTPNEEEVGRLSSSSSSPPPAEPLAEQAQSTGY
jgi:hypothetical protein